MRKVAGPGNVSGAFADYDPVTNPNGTVVTANWANDVQLELLGIQDSAGIAESAGSNEYVLAAIEYITKKNSFPVGAVVPIPGNYRAPTAFDKDSPGTFFPAVCLTAFTGTDTIAAANYPLLVPQLRSEKLIYLEELTGEAATFAGTAAGSVVTLTANTANEDLAAGLAEWHADMGEYPAVVIGGTTYEVTNVDSVALEITLGAAPPAGAVTLEIYPHRIAGSSTTARLWSWVGKTAIGAGTTETLAMMMRRDQMQQITGVISETRNGGIGEEGAFTRGTTVFNGPGAGGDIANFRYFFDSANSPNARTSPTTDTEGATHSPDVSVHWYQWAGTYSA